MRNTSLMKILADSTFPMGKVVIHPNDGADLNLFQVSYPIRLYHSMTVMEFRETEDVNCPRENIPGELLLSNSCKVGTVELSMKLCSHLKNPKNAVVIFEEGRVLLAVK